MSLSKLGKFKLLILFGLITKFLLSPNVFASEQCVKQGYTIVTINGIFTNESGAAKNANALFDRIGETYNEESLAVKYLFNPSHVGGLGDLAKSVYQKYLDDEAVSDYDLMNMLADASEKVRTQKLLLVAHSQGNFYANSFYDVVADQAGGVPKESIGVYGIATPAGRVAGVGKWLTSDTDTVIAGIAASAPFKNIMEPNTHIELQNGDDFLGHDFSNVYLKYRGERIVSDIQNALTQLSANNVQNEQKLCFGAPELTLTHKVTGAVLAFADPVMNKTMALTAGVVTNSVAVVYETNKFIAQVGEQVSLAMSQFLRKETDTSGLALVAEIPLKKNSDVFLDQSKEIRPPEVDFNTQSREVGSPKVSLADDNQDEDAAERLVNANRISNNQLPISNSVFNTVGVTSVSGSAGQGEVAVAQCKYGGGGTPTRQKLLINEVAWMGGIVSANDEWLEVKNISDGSLDISGWQILDKAEQIKITFPGGTKLGADGLMLLERTDDDSVPSVVADLVYTGALSNTDEGLWLFDKNCVLVDEVTASPDWPAGESATRKTMERLSDLSWQTSVTVSGTPKKDNTASSSSPQTNDQQQTQPLPEASAGEATNHLVISEVQITGGSGATTNDFIELYNPTDQPVNLNGYRLVKRTKTGISDTSIKSWTSDAFVPAKGFYLWANSNYTSIGVIPDVTTTASIADDNGIALRQGAADTGTIIDSAGWGEAQNAFVEGAVFAANPGANQSIERKAYSSGCVSAQNSGEYLGNSCDTNSNSSDFELRSVATPQNSQSFPEPRPSPAQAQNFNVSYSSSALELVLNWDQSQDYNGATSSVKYLISHSTSTPDNLKNIAELTDATSYQFKINDLGVTHYLGVTVRDAEGLSATTTTANTSIGTPFSNFYFYQDTRSTTSQKYLLDFYYQNYPFVSDIYRDGAQDGWKILVFYLNREAPDEIELNADNNWQSAAITGALDVVYSACAGGNAPRYSLILPDNETRCGIGGGIENSALNWNNLEDLHLLVELATTTGGIIFTESDFITVGMYSLYDSGSGDQKFKLVGLDRNKYYFATATPSHQPPVFDGGPLELNFNEDQSELNVSWQAATDLDTLDNLITYEINYSTTTEFADFGWQNNGSSVVSQRQVSPGDSFLIGVRVKDDFGNFSEILTAEWSYPEATYYISQTQTNGWSASFGTKNPNCPSCPDTANLQSIQSEEDFEFNTVVLKLRQEEVSDTADVRLSVYPDNGDFPDFDSLLAAATLKNLLNPNSNSDIAFIFNEPVSLTGGEIYWLVLDVEKYSSGNTGFFRNQWQNAADTGNDFYADGWAGKGTAGVCDGYCDFTIPYPDELADWYMKIGQN